MTSLPSWGEAWARALYGEDGFFLRSRPRDHFRTSVHASPLFAEAVLRLVVDNGFDTVVDVGAGGGELLQQLHALAASLHLVGVELAARPADLPTEVRWQPDLPGRIDGLVIANEWLDNIPCDVVEMDDHGAVRRVHVDPHDGREELGDEVKDPWLDRWWPLRDPATRAEIGRPRDEAWADLVSRLGSGVAIAVDYGHTTKTRPAFGSLTSYRCGRLVDVVPDGTRDVTAHVAFDSLGADELATQRDALRSLGICADRPAPASAHTDPHGYLRALGDAAAAGELTAATGLGGFTWAITRVAR